MGFYLAGCKVFIFVGGASVGGIVRRVGKAWWQGVRYWPNSGGVNRDQNGGVGVRFLFRVRFGCVRGEGVSELGKCT